MEKKKLRLPLTRQWFEMTKYGEKTEDYREVNAYWCSRLLLYKGQVRQVAFWDGYISCFGNNEDFVSRLKYLTIEAKDFASNVMTLGCPKKGDKDKILEYEHLGIEIREGREEWGAKSGIIYFVIKHGKKI